MSKSSRPGSKKLKPLVARDVRRPSPCGPCLFKFCRVHVLLLPFWQDSGFERYCHLKGSSDSRGRTRGKREHQSMLAEKDEIFKATRLALKPHKAPRAVKKTINCQEQRTSIKCHHKHHEAKTFLPKSFMLWS